MFWESFEPAKTPISMQIFGLRPMRKVNCQGIYKQRLPICLGQEKRSEAAPSI